MQKPFLDSGIDNMNKQGAEATDFANTDNEWNKEVDFYMSYGNPLFY